MVLNIISRFRLVQVFETVVMNYNIRECCKSSIVVQATFAGVHKSAFPCAT